MKEKTAQSRMYTYSWECGGKSGKNQTRAKDAAEAREKACVAASLRACGTMDRRGEAIITNLKPNLKGNYAHRIGGIS